MSAFVLHFSTGMMSANFVPKRTLKFACNLLRAAGTCTWCRPGLIHGSSSSNSSACSGFQWVVLTNSSERLTAKREKVYLHSAGPLRRYSSHQDADVKRMQQVIQQTGRPRPQTSGGNDDRLIYRVKSLGMMRMCTAFFYVTSLTGLYVTPDIIASTLEHDTINVETIVNSFTIIAAVVVLPTLLTMFNNRLVLRLYYSEARKSYVAMTQSPFLTLRKSTFNHQDIVPVKKTGTLFGMMSLNTLRAKGRPYYVNPYNFNIPSDYNHMMGYNRFDP